MCPKFVFETVSIFGYQGTAWRPLRRIKTAFYKVAVNQIIAGDAAKI